MEKSTRQLVRRRAHDCCEYCRLPQHSYLPRFHVEHIRARSHQGTDDPENLALSCPRCNRQKGPNLSAYDPETKHLVPLFHPRTDVWEEHFLFRGSVIVGLTAAGRATVHLLKMNEEERLILRRHLNQREELR